MNDETSSKQPLSAGSFIAHRHLGAGECLARNALLHPSVCGKNSMRDEQTAGSQDNFSFKLQSDRLRWSFEDPMHNYLKLQKIKDKEERVKELQSMLESSSSSSDISSDSSPKKRKRSQSDKSHRKHKKRKKEKVSSEKRKECNIEKDTHRHGSHKKRKKDKKHGYHRKSEKRKRQREDSVGVSPKQDACREREQKHSKMTDRAYHSEKMDRPEQQTKRSKHRHKKHKHS